jgi:broad specificity phosphatase PhoE
MKIYLVRHTEADDDRRDSYGGIADDPLIESGRKYARSTGQVLSNKGIEVIYTSPYMRARETAELINESINVHVVEIYNLRERNSYGVLSGIEKNRSKALFPSIQMRVQQMKENGTKPSTSIETLPGAEIYLDLLLRAKDAFNQIFREGKLASFKCVAVVTHGGFAWAFFNDVVRIPTELEKGEIVVLEGDNIDALRINEEETNEFKKKIGEKHGG